MWMMDGEVMTDTSRTSTDVELQSSLPQSSKRASIQTAERQLLDVEHQEITINSSLNNAETYHKISAEVEEEAVHVPPSRGRRWTFLPQNKWYVRKSIIAWRKHLIRFPSMVKSAAKPHNYLQFPPVRLNKGHHSSKSIYNTYLGKTNTSYESVYDHDTNKHPDGNSQEARKHTIIFKRGDSRKNESLRITNIKMKPNLENNDFNEKIVPCTKLEEFQRDSVKNFKFRKRSATHEFAEGWRSYSSYKDDPSNNHAIISNEATIGRNSFAEKNKANSHQHHQRETLKASPGTIEEEVNESQVTAVLELSSLTRTDNGKMFTCVAHNSKLTASKTRQVMVTMIRKLIGF